MTLSELGYTAFFSQEVTTEELLSGLLPARVTAEHRGAYRVEGEDFSAAATLKSAAFYRDAATARFPAVGDFVLVRCDAGGSAEIVRLLPRKSLFSRAAPGKKHRTTADAEQVVAANFDMVLLMESLNQNFSVRRMERYLVSSVKSGAVPVIVLTKADLCPDVPEKLSEMQRIAPGVAIHAVSVVTGEGLPALRDYLAPGWTLALLGSSGVGKSTLVNALSGEIVMRTGEIREDDGRGRHTTTYRQLLRLPSGALLLDTPGMRELGIWDVEEGVQDTFADVEALATECRFSDCKHDREPGCAVRRAIESGELAEARFRSYQKLMAEAAGTAGRARVAALTRADRQNAVNRRRR